MITQVPEPMMSESVTPESIAAERSHATLGMDDDAWKRYAEILQGLPWPQPQRSAAESLRTLGVTSCCRGEGVSTTAAHLAVAAARRGEGRVLLMDCDLARPAAHSWFALRNAPGVAECLLDGEPAGQFVRPSGVANLWLLTAGHLHGSPARAYQSDGMVGLLKEVAADYDLTVCDLPPAAQTSCTAHLAGLLDGLLWVLEADRVPLQAARRVKELLVRAEARLLGAVLNKRQERISD